MNNKLKELALFLYEKEKEDGVEYMNKELVFGCITRLPKQVAFPDNLHYIDNIGKCHPSGDKKYVIHYCNPKSYRFADELDDEIIWTLWLSSILKYIDNKVWLWSDYNWISYMEYITRDLKLLDKELINYTEEELESLIIKLKELW